MVTNDQPLSGMSTLRLRWLALLGSQGARRELNHRHRYRAFLSEIGKPRVSFDEHMARNPAVHELIKLQAEATKHQREQESKPEPPLPDLDNLDLEEKVWDRLNRERTQCQPLPTVKLPQRHIAEVVAAVKQPGVKFCVWRGFPVTTRDGIYRVFRDGAWQDAPHDFDSMRTRVIVESDWRTMFPDVPLSPLEESHAESKPHLNPLPDLDSSEVWARALRSRREERMRERAIGDEA
jgi:hypothetical protein